MSSFIEKHLIVFPFTKLKAKEENPTNPDKEVNSEADVSFFLSRCRSHSCSRCWRSLLRHEVGDSREQCLIIEYKSCTLNCNEMTNCFMLSSLICRKKVAFEILWTTWTKHTKFKNFCLPPIVWNNTFFCSAESRTVVS